MQVRSRSTSPTSMRSPSSSTRTGGPRRRPQRTRLDQQLHEHARLLHFGLHRQHPGRLHPAGSAIPPGPPCAQLPGGVAPHPALGRSRRDVPDRRHRAEPLSWAALQGGRGHHGPAPRGSTSPSISVSRTSAAKCKKCARECPSGAISDGARRCTTATRNGLPT